MAQKVHREIYETIPSLVRYESAESAAEAARRLADGHRLVAPTEQSPFLNGISPSGGDIVGNRYKLLWPVQDDGTRKIFVAADLESERPERSASDWYLSLVYCSSDGSKTVKRVEDQVKGLLQLSRAEIVKPTCPLWRERGFSFFASGYYRHQGYWTKGLMSVGEGFLPTIADHLFNTRIPYQRSIYPFCQLFGAIAEAHEFKVPHGELNDRHVFLGRSETGGDIELRLAWPMFFGRWRAPQRDAYVSDIRGWASVLLSWSSGGALPPLGEISRINAIVAAQPWSDDFREFVERCLFLRSANATTARDMFRKIPHEQQWGQEREPRSGRWIS